MDPEIFGPVVLAISIFCPIVALAFLIVYRGGYRSGTDGAFFQEYQTSKEEFLETHREIRKHYEEALQAIRAKILKLKPEPVAEGGQAADPEEAAMQEELKALNEFVRHEPNLIVGLLKKLIDKSTRVQNPYEPESGA
ncbi:MAG: hypothetical protein HY717_07150 [Planctomycetes bacterium]|nr:hypothetical protein [Planctomycetota bacterium]